MPEDSLASRAKEIQEQLDQIPHILVSEAKRLVAEHDADAHHKILVLELKTAQLELELERANARILRMAQAPKWLQPAGMSIGLLTLLFFMALVGASLFGKVVPETGKFPVLIVLGLGTALSASFLSGYAFVSGQIPFFGDKHPLAVSAGGGFAILILILLIGWKIYL